MLLFHCFSVCDDRSIYRHIKVWIWSKVKNKVLFLHHNQQLDCLRAAEGVVLCSMSGPAALMQPLRQPSGMWESSPKTDEQDRGQVEAARPWRPERGLGLRLPSGGLLTRPGRETKTETSASLCLSEASRTFRSWSTEVTEDELQLMIKHLDGSNVVEDFLRP